MNLDFCPANWTKVLSFKPAFDAVLMKFVEASQSEDLIIIFIVHLADHTFVSI